MMEDILQRNKAIYQCIKAKINFDAIDRESINKNLMLIEKLGYFAWRNHPGCFFDADIENVLLRYGGQLETLVDTERISKYLDGFFSTQKEWATLHIATEIAAVGGHTRVIHQVIKRSREMNQCVALTGRDASTVPEWFKSGVEAFTDIISLRMYKTHIEKAYALRHLSKYFKRVVIYAHPFDIVAPLAFAQKSDIAVAVENHAHSWFWYGRSIADLMICHSKYHLDFSKKYRMADQCFYMPFAQLDMANDWPNLEEKRKAKALLGIDPCKTVILSVATREKFIPNRDYNHFDLMTEILDRHPDVLCMIIGISGQDTLVKNISDSERMIFHPYIQDLTNYYLASDICLESMPEPSLGVQTQAPVIGLSCPIPKYGKAKVFKSHNLLQVDLYKKHFGREMSKDDFFEKLDLFIKDSQLRIDVAKEIRAHFNIFEDQVLYEKLLQLYETMDLLHHNPKTLSETVFFDDDESHEIAERSEFQDIDQVIHFWGNELTDHDQFRIRFNHGRSPAGFLEKPHEDIIIKENTAFCQKGVTSIIILTHNQLEYTKKCIKSIFKHTKELFELIVVDNGSTDGTVEYLESEAGEQKSEAGGQKSEVRVGKKKGKGKKKKSKKSEIRIKIIKNKENLGFAAGNNQGMAAAEGDYILLMNNDLVVTPGWLGRLIACAERKPQIGIVGPVSNYVSGPQLVKEVSYNTTSLARLNKFSRAFARKHSEETEPFWRVVGFCMLIKRAVIEKIGGLDGRYGLGNFEDDDFSLRAALAGFESWIAQDCFVHHFGSRTFAGAKIDYRESLHKNWEIFKQKWGIPADVACGAPYDMASAVKSGFIPEKHYCPLMPGEYSVADGEKLFGMGDIEGAKRIFEQIVSTDSNNIEALNNLGVIAFQQGETDQAISYFTRVLETDESYFEAIENLGKCAEVQKDYLKAAEWFERALKLKPDDISLLNSMGNCFIQTENLSKAREVYEKLLGLDDGQENIKVILRELEGLEEYRHCLPANDIEMITNDLRRFRSSDRYMSGSRDSKIVELSASSGSYQYNLKISLELNQFSQKIMWNCLSKGQFYEQGASNFLASALREGDSFIDIGSHIGYFSLLASVIVGSSGQVFAIEPETSNFDQLTTNISLNKFSNIKTFNLALGSKIEQKQFFINKDNDGGHALWNVGLHPFNKNSRANPVVKDINTATLDSLFEDNNPDSLKLIKMDVEGSEYAILQGGTNMISRHNVPYIICEINRFALQQMGTSEKELRRYMELSGYETYLLNDEIPYFTRLSKDDYIETNYVFNVIFSKAGNPNVPQQH